MARQHLAWASKCCGQPAYSTPNGHLGEATTNRVCRVVCTAPPVKGKCISKSALWCYDATPVYRAFALEEALRVAHLWVAPPIVLRYLRTGDESIRVAAEDAARAAARAARAATWAAASDAARAAGAAAWATAWAAAGDAGDAAWAAARDAAWDAAWAAARAAAGDAAGDAARAAARKRQNRRLAKLLNDGRRLYSQRVVP